VSRSGAQAIIEILVKGQGNKLQLERGSYTRVEELGWIRNGLIVCGISNLGDGNFGGLSFDMSKRRLKIRFFI